MPASHELHACLVAITDAVWWAPNFELAWLSFLEDLGLNNAACVLPNQFFGAFRQGASTMNLKWPEPSPTWYAIHVLRKARDAKG